MNSEKTLRDELAMSLEHEAIPTFTGMDGVREAEKSFGIEYGDTTESQIDFALKYASRIRYRYADFMLAERESKSKKT